MEEKKKKFTPAIVLYLLLTWPFTLPLFCIFWVMEKMGLDIEDYFGYTNRVLNRKANRALIEINEREKAKETAKIDSQSQEQRA